MQRKATFEPASWAEERGLHFQESAGGFGRADDRRAWTERLFTWRRAGQRSPREFLRECGPGLGGGHPGADRGRAPTRAAGLRGDPGQRGRGFERVKPIERDTSAT